MIEDVTVSSDGPLGSLPKGHNGKLYKSGSIGPVWFPVFADLKMRLATFLLGRGA